MKTAALARLRASLFLVCALLLLDNCADPKAPTTSASGFKDVKCAATSMVDEGTKGSLSSVGRGAYSDTKMVPAYHGAAVAFSDAGALGIKLSYWNGTGYTTETVAGDGGASYVRLAMLSNSTPLVFWTLGANVKVAIRSAPLTQNGAWVAGVIDVGVAPRALEVAVNPLDQVAVVYLTDTATTGRAKFLYCDSPCANPANFQTMTLNPAIENANILASQVAVGVGWCQGPSSFYPAATYSVAAGTRYAVCTNSLGNCLNGSNWTNTTISATASVASKLLIDSTVAGDVPKVVTSGSSGIVPYRMGSSSCATGVSAFSAGAALGTASSASQWMSFLKDGSGLFHLVANEGSTSVRYYNSTTTDPIAPWNGAGIVDVTTLYGATGGGAHLDPLSAELAISYGQNALPFDLKLARVNDMAVPSNVATFSLATPNLHGNLQLAAGGAQLKNIAMANTSSWVPGVAYVDFSNGATANAKLKFALRQGQGSSSLWPTSLVAATINPQFPSLAFDDNDRPWIAYFEAATNKFYLVTNAAKDGSGAWTSYQFPSVPAGAPVALPAANNTALVTVKNNGSTNLLMAVIDTNITSKGIRTALFNKSSRSWSAPVLVDGLTSGALGAAHLSLASHSLGIAMAYQDLSLSRVKYAYSAAATTWSTPLAISAVGQGQGVSIALRATDGLVGVSYFAQTSNTVYYNSCAQPSTCASGGWSALQIESAAGVSALPANSSQLLSTSLHYLSTGAVAIFYPRGQGSDGNLVLADNSQGSFRSQIGGYGVNANLLGSPALNFAVAGWGVSSAFNSSGLVSAVYLGPGNLLYSSNCGE